MSETGRRKQPQNKARPYSETVLRSPLSIPVKFRDSVTLPYVDGVEKYFDHETSLRFEQLKKVYPAITFLRTHTALKPAGIRQLVARAVRVTPEYRSPNFLTYFRLVSKSRRGDMTTAQAKLLVKELRRWDDIVESAYISPQFRDPTTDNPPNPLSASQGYLNAAPEGIDARYLWKNSVVGGDGDGTPKLKLIDLEQGWTLDHQDLPTSPTDLLSGFNDPLSRGHGTAVVGIVSAKDNALGCIGVVPKLGSVKAISYIPTNGDPKNIANAILNATKSLDFGDVLILEVEAVKPLNPGINLGLPVELNDPGIIRNDPAIYANIALATALGILVVEPAGNGPNADLDSFPELNRAGFAAGGNPKFQDSGAIVVGAATKNVPHQPAGNLGGRYNVGSRIDCYAWGEGVVTPTSGPNGSRTDYCGVGGKAAFSATSAATAIVAGAALAVQGMAQAKGFRLNPKQLRDVLSDRTPSAVPGVWANTPSANPAADKIGVMPNLAWIHQAGLLLAPDIYIRDFVGDIGDPHTGAISASPDIIVRNVAVANPTAAFGFGSGNENSATLSSEVKAGQDNSIYVRALNKGPSAATNVTATVYWSPPATLVTPNLWTLVGSVQIPIVPPNLLTVSEAITWPAANIPATGHYCFVGLLGNAADPAPNQAAFADWNSYQNFIRNNNNVTWRNFNVVSSEKRLLDGLEYVVLAFLAPGAPDKTRPMTLEVRAQLPPGARVWLEGPGEFLDRFDGRRAGLEHVQAGDLKRVKISPQGRSILGQADFPAESRTSLRLLVHVPEKLRANAYDLHASQFFEHLEVGRITWRLQSPGKKIGNDAEASGLASPTFRKRKPRSKTK